jgi:hypothetical protein
MSEFASVKQAFSLLVSGLKGDVGSLSSDLSRKDEGALLENARATALQVTRLVDLVEGRVKDVCIELGSKSEGLEDAASHVRVCVLGLLQKAKSSFENPLDFVRRQELSDALHQVDQELIRLEGRFDQIFGLSEEAATAASVVVAASVPSADSLFDSLNNFGTQMAILVQVLQQHELETIHEQMKVVVYSKSEKFFVKKKKKSSVVFCV